MEAPQSQLEALLTAAAFAPIQNVGWVHVGGEDRVRWLNGMVTNSIQALKPGQSCYNFFLNAQGRIQGDCTAWMGDYEHLLLETAADRVPQLLEYLDRFIIMDEVELQPVGRLQGIEVIGPEAVQLLELLPIPWPDNGLDFDPKKDDHDPSIYKVYSPLVPRFVLWQDERDVPGLLAHLRKLNIPEASPKALEHLRLLEATPLYGTDIRDKDLPQETNQTRALHFSKGCYLGQEIVERIRSRGQVNRLFTPLLLTGETPAPGTILTANDKPAGEITSAAEVPGHGILALGYVRREALDTHAPLTYPGGTATTRAVSSQLKAVG